MTLQTTKRSLLQSPLLIALGLFGFSACSKDSKNKDTEDKYQRSLSESQDLARKAAALEAAQSQAESQLAANIQALNSLNHDAAAHVEAIRVLEEDNRSLASEMETNRAELDAIKVELDSTRKTLSEKTAQIEAISAELAAKTAMTEKLNSDLTAKDKRISELDTQLTQNQASMADLQAQLKNAMSGNMDELNKSLAAKTEENARLVAELSSAQGEKTELAKQLTDTQLELSTLKKDHAKLQAEMNDRKYDAVKVFLENMGPETVFAVNTWHLRAAYKLAEGEECMFIFNIDRNVQFTKNDWRNPVPQLADIEMYPMRVGYQKVAICQTKAGELRAQKETGHIYKAVSEDNEDERRLITARKEGSCDNQAEEVKAKNIYSSEYQFTDPYRGSIDGIETFDLLRPEGKYLEYTMGSGHWQMAGRNCEVSLASVRSTPLAHLACKLAMGQKPEDLNVSVGCFTENKSGDVTTLQFHK